MNPVTLKEWLVGKGVREGAVSLPNHCPSKCLPVGTGWSLRDDERTFAARLHGNQWDVPHPIMENTHEKSHQIMINYIKK